MTNIPEVKFFDEIITDRTEKPLSIWWSTLNGRVFRAEYSSSLGYFNTEVAEIEEVA